MCGDVAFSMHKAYFWCLHQRIYVDKLGRKPKPNAKRFWLSVRMNQDDLDIWVRILQYFEVKINEPKEALTSHAFRELLRMARLRLDVEEAEKRLQKAPLWVKELYETAF